MGPSKWGRGAVVSPSSRFPCNFIVSQSGCGTLQRATVPMPLSNPRKLDAPRHVAGHMHTYMCMFTHTETVPEIHKLTEAQRHTLAAPFTLTQAPHSPAH